MPLKSINHVQINIALFIQHSTQHTIYRKRIEMNTHICIITIYICTCIYLGMSCSSSKTSRGIVFIQLQTRHVSLPPNFPIVTEFGSGVSISAILLHIWNRMCWLKDRSPVTRFIILGFQQQLKSVICYYWNLTNFPTNKLYFWKEIWK